MKNLEISVRCRLSIIFLFLFCVTGGHIAHTTAKPFVHHDPSPKAVVRRDWKTLDSGFRLNATNTPIPVEDFFRKPARDRYRLSPNGLSVSFLAPFQGGMNLHVQRVGEGPPRRITGFDDRDVSFQLWKTDQILLFGRDAQGDESHHLFRVNADGSELRDLTPFKGCKATLLDELPSDPDHVLITLSRDSQQVPDVHRLNIRTEAMNRVAVNTGGMVDWLADHEGRVRIAVEKSGSKTRLLHRPAGDAAFTAFVECDPDVTIRPLLFTFDNRNLYAASNRGRDKLALVVLDLASGEETAVLFEGDPFDIHALSASHRRKVLTDVTFFDWKLRHHFLDALSRTLHERWARRFGEANIEPVEWAADEKRVLLRVSSDRSPASYWLYTVESDEMVLLAQTHPWLDETALRPMLPICFAAWDGALLHGYLTLPETDRNSELPTVLKVHGGPWQRDVWGYDAEVQFLASRGYAVLQLNYRGSTGYGKRFWADSFKQWGLRMQDDLSAGVRWLVDQSIADPERIAVYGSSYGGYAALAGLAFTPELYACGVAVSAPTDLCRLLEDVPARWKPWSPSLHRMVGDPLVDRDQLEAVSPACHPQRVTAPVLIAHGKRDPRVSFEDGLKLVSSVKSHNNSVEWHLFEDEGHWITRQENRVTLLRTIEAFLAKNLQLGDGH